MLATYLRQHRSPSPSDTHQGSPCRRNCLLLMERDEALMAVLFQVLSDANLLLAHHAEWADLTADLAFAQLWM